MDTKLDPTDGTCLCVSVWCLDIVLSVGVSCIDPGGNPRKAGEGS